MFNSFTKIVLFLLLIVIVISCDATKYVPKGKYLLENNTVIVNDKKENSPEVLGYLQQRPNQKILGIPFSLHIYNLGNPDTLSLQWPDNKPKFKNWLTKKISTKQVNALSRSSKGFNKWLLKSGNAPVISDSTKIEKSALALRRYYFFNGFRDVLVDFDEQKNDKKGINVEYTVNTGKPYFLDSIYTDIESPVLDSIYKSNRGKSFIKKGQQFRAENFEKEEERLINLYRNSGIYRFGNNMVKFDVDTSELVNYKQDVLLKIANQKISQNDTIVEIPFKVQKVKRINVFTDFSFETKDLINKDSGRYSNINFYATEKLRYNPKYLSNSIIIEPNGIYKDTERDLTRKSLRELENFKPSIDINYEENEDETLTANIYLSPLKKYSLAWDTDFTISNIKPFGILGRFSFLNRNVFKGAEIFELSFQGSFINTPIGNVDDKSFFNASEIGTTASLKIPRILFPLNTEKLIPKRMSPKTNISFGLGIQDNIGLDRRNITGSLDYTWKSSLKSSHKFELLNLQYINNRNEDAYFSVYQSELDKIRQVAFPQIPDNSELNVIPAEDIPGATNSEGDFFPQVYLDTITNIANGYNITHPNEFAFLNNIEQQREILIEDVLVPVISYAYNYNNRENFKDNSFSTFAGRLISSGSLTTAFVKNTNENDRKVLFGLPVAQYVKTEIEHKKYWAFNQNSTLVLRNFIGAAIPFGNSEDIPFSRSYRAGGSNDIRAWRTFELGPGSLDSDLEFNVGSLKLTSNLEYRFKLINSLNGALFVDAGNIWDISRSNIIDSKAKFTGFNSLKQIAVGSGFGARYDFSFLIFRLDLGFKTYEPYLESSSKWFKNYNFKNSVLNIGINYPF